MHLPLHALTPVVLVTLLVTRVWGIQAHSHHNSLSNLSSSPPHMNSVLYTTCASITNCTACYETSGCHWCRSANTSDTNNCHVYGIYGGCLVGQVCAVSSACTRSTPEWRGYGTPSKGVVGMGVIIGIFLLCSLGCLCFCLSYYQEKQSRHASDIQMDRIRTAVAAAGGAHAGGAGGVGVEDQDAGHYIPLSALTHPSHKRQSSHERPSSLPATRSIESDESDDEVEQMYGDGIPSPRQERKQQQHEKKQRLLTHTKIQTRSVLVNSDDEVLDLSNAFTPRPPSRSRLYCLRFVYTIIILGMLATFIGMIVGILFYPQVPQYSMCTRTVEWDTIIKYMTETFPPTFKADVETQFAIYNPNRFGIYVSEATAIISYKGTPFMTGSLRDREFVAGSITDVIVNGQFTPESVSMANTLYWAHADGSLLIDIAMSIATSESVFHHTFYNYNATMKMYGVDTSVPDSKEYCVCQDTT